MDIGEYSDIRSLSTVLQLYGGRYIKILLSILHMACLSTKVARQILLSTFESTSGSTYVQYTYLRILFALRLRYVYTVQYFRLILILLLFGQIYLNIDTHTHTVYTHTLTLFIHTNTLSRYIVDTNNVFFVAYGEQINNKVTTLFYTFSKE